MILEKKHVPLILRVGLGLVFLVLGANKATRPEIWVGWIPIQLKAFIPDANQFLIFNGIIEAILGLLLIIGLYTKIAAALSGLFLFFVLLFFGADDITSRDIGLMAMAAAIILLGPGEASVDEKYLRR